MADKYMYAVTFLCSFPCKSCLTNQPLACTACQTTLVGNNLLYLYNRTCIAGGCPDNFYSIVNNVETYVCLQTSVSFTATLTTPFSLQASDQPLKYTFNVDPLLPIPINSTLALTFPA